MFVCCECCVSSGRGLCDELITCPEESYQLWCVVTCDLETSRMRRPWPALGCSAIEKKKVCKEGDKSSCHIYKGMTLLSHYCHKICERILCNEIKN
jgi:hypothetical protein